MKGTLKRMRVKHMGERIYKAQNPKRFPMEFCNDICYILGSFQYYQFTRGMEDFGIIGYYYRDI